ncbi:MAG: 1-phosphofructokinase [Omnitrophica bacterium RIFCSPHIGHO2_02_FULL_51_18]|nr:MAG: 1-phosphofructokinase [Omnitrophica bacterium RIFCSPHIGHO2_02_FULL_51_18]
MIATVTINPSIDQHMVIDKLVKDDAIRVREIRRFPGGKGINVSRAVKELGGETVAFSVAGGCAGYMLKSLLTDQGIFFQAIEVPQETRINVIVTDQSDKTQTRMSAEGPRMELKDVDELFKKILSCVPFPEWWVLGGSLPPGVPSDFYARLITLLQGQGAKCILDADDEPLKLGIQSKPYLIKPNEYEMERLAGRSLTSESSLVEAATEIVESGIEMVVVTLGKKGALVVTRELVCYATTPQVPVKSRVGAGDSFLAGFVTGLVRKSSLEETLRFAMACGTAAIMNDGTALCRSADVEKILPQIKTREIKPVTKLRPKNQETKNKRDVVCGMSVDPGVSSFSVVFDGQDYRFCSLKCRESFQKNPRHFIEVETIKSNKG